MRLGSRPDLLMEDGVVEARGVRSSIRSDSWTVATRHPVSHGDRSLRDDRSYLSTILNCFCYCGNSTSKIAQLLEQCYFARCKITRKYNGNTHPSSTRLFGSRTTSDASWSRTWNEQEHLHTLQSSVKSVRYADGLRDGHAAPARAARGAPPR